MAWGIDQVEKIFLSVLGAIGQTYCLAFDGDATFSLDLHVVKELVLKLAIGDQVAILNHSVGEGRFAVVNMRNNAEISDIVHSYGGLQDGERVGSRLPASEANVKFPDM